MSCQFWMYKKPHFEIPLCYSFSMFGANTRHRKIRVPRAKRPYEESSDPPTPRKRPEEDERYRRVDFSSQHAYEARQLFLHQLSVGPGIDLARAALAIAAEDDALVSHSSVKFPDLSYLQRLERIANDVAFTVLPTLSARNARGRVEAVYNHLFGTLGFTTPAMAGGRSNIPIGSTVDHPGVYEDARHAYINEALVRKRGIPAILAVIAADIYRRLLEIGAIEFAVRLDVKDLTTLPTVELLEGISRESAIVPGTGTPLNFCTTDTLAECLLFLRRAYWPYTWDAKLGGFQSAARAFLNGGEDAELEAIARTARHRLDRGIWTSPGAGDLRRALAAAERLVLLRPECAEDRLYLSVSYCHVGKLSQAKAELKEYYRLLGSAPGRRPFKLSTSSGLLMSDSSDDRVAAEILDVLQQVRGVRTVECLSVESALHQPAPEQQDNVQIPLTW